MDRLGRPCAGQVASQQVNFPCDFACQRIGTMSGVVRFLHECAFKVGTKHCARGQFDA